MKRLISWWGNNFIGAEFVLSVITAVAFSIWAFRFGGSLIIADVFHGNRAAVYGALASIFGSLLGFAITAESIVLGLSGSGRLQVISTSRHYKTFWRVFIAAIRALALATALALLGLVLDRDSRPCQFVFVLNVFGFVIASFRLMRCIWVLENVVALVSSPSMERRGGE